MKYILSWKNNHKYKYWHKNIIKYIISMEKYTLEWITYKEETVWNTGEPFWVKKIREDLFDSWKRVIFWIDSSNMATNIQVVEQNDSCFNCTECVHDYIDPDDEEREIFEVYCDWLPQFWTDIERNSICPNFIREG